MKKTLYLFSGLGAGERVFQRLDLAKVLKWPNALADWFFGVTAVKDRLILARILNDTDPDFLKWAIDKVTR